MKKEYLEAGEFVNTHGIAGELRLYPWCDSPAFLTDFKTLYLDAAGKTPLSAQAVRVHKNLCIVKLGGVDSIEQAHDFVGKTVYIRRGDVNLEPGRYFVQDLLGASVVDADTAAEYGRVAEVSHPGHHDVWRIEGEKGEWLFPAVEPFLVELDIEAGRALVRPIAGMFDEEAPKPSKPPKPPKPPKKREKA